MPELPEVETMRRGVAGIVGGVIRDARRTPCRLKPIRITPGPAVLRRRVVGRTVSVVDRIGKRVLVRLSGGDALVFEPRMAGLILLAEPPDVEHVRFRVDVDAGSSMQLLYWDRRGLGSVRLLSPADLLAELGPHRLGPDALVVTAGELRQRLGVSRREIKVALLDQRAVAGVGNLYASEMLHRAGIHPGRPCDRLTNRQWTRLHAAIQEILREAIRHEGSTLADGTYRNALNNPGGYQNQHRVYDRAGQRCPVCERGYIRRIVQAQRSTFFCPCCQRAS
ncbi:MAG: bifunctional DNA-formamidopyrimidine glycosylase/DNA-(apurinic or apyrimidinic site) lyase [Planctomycetota bacterium]